MRGILLGMSQFVTQTGDDKARRLQRILDIVVDEAMEELDERGSMFLGEFLLHFAKLMEWAVTGDYATLPEMLIPFAAAVDGIDVTKIEENARHAGEQLALVAAGVEA